MFLRLPWLVPVITPFVLGWLPAAIMGGISLFSSLWGGRQQSQAHKRQLTSEDARHAASLADRAEARRMAREDWRFAMDTWLEERKARREAATSALGPLLAQTPLSGVDPSTLVAASGQGLPPQMMMPPTDAQLGGAIPVTSAGAPPMQGGGGMSPFVQAMLYDSLMGGGGTSTPETNIISDWKM